MNTAKHTPGPWTPERDRAKSLSLYSGSTFICEVYHEVDEPSTQEQANVRLIAAAPAMYEALKLCKAFIDHGPSATRSAARCKEVYDNALAQAEGK